MVSLGENVSLFINSSAGLEHTENIFRTSSDEQSDTALIFQPGIEIDFGREGASRSVLTLGYKMFQYFDDDSLNTELIKSSFTTRYDSGVTLFTGEVSYNEFGTALSASPDNLGSISDPTVSERSITRVGGDVKYRISDQLAIGGGLLYYGRSYDADSLADLDRFDVPLRVYYRIAPELDLVAGYRYREVNNDQPNLPEYADNYFFIGLDGEIFNPLWRLELDLGYQEREYQNSIIDTDDSFSARVKVTYRADANRSYFAIVSRDYATSPGGALTYIQDQILAGMQYRLSEMWLVDGAVAFLKNDYQEVTLPREEDIVYAQVGVTYKPNEYLTFGGTIRYISVDGSGSSSAIDYDQQVFSVTASFRY